ncbi:Ribonuclease H domain [Macleaya cordata]|uniref:Ribonuclease H domain n=1 Tax=Macleaya cordata TaxID=56857 RepID=A0A200PS80_MACCD|nr:Ribonuclease H domain [Macleaya cordata]
MIYTRTVICTTHSQFIWQSLLKFLGFDRALLGDWESEMQWCASKLEVRLKFSTLDAKVEDTDHNRQLVAKWNINAVFQRHQEIRCSWKGPDEDFVQLNSDGSLNNDSGGFGAILRDRCGDAISAVAGSSRPSSVIHHELQGVEAGLKLASSYGFRKICVGSDSQTVVSYFNITKAKPPWQEKHLWRRIQRLVHQFDTFKVEHVYRDTNRAADHLASLRPSCEFLEIIPSSFSEDLKKIIFEDKCNFVYFR